MAGEVEGDTNEKGTRWRQIMRRVALINGTNADGGVRAMNRRAKVLEKDVFES